MLSFFSLLVYSLIVLCVLQSCSAKRMWGSRKKKDDESETQATVIPQKKVEVPRKRASEAIQSRGTLVDTIGNVASSNGLGGIEDMVKMYLNMVDELIDSDDFKKLVNPESIKNILDQFPGVMENPDLATIFSSAEFNNPTLLRSTMKEGIRVLKSSMPDIMGILADPSKISEFTSQLPPEFRSLLQGITSGDLSGLKDVINTLPGLEDSHRSILTSLLEGKTDGLAQELKQLLGDGDQIEAARQQFLANPEVAQQMGIPSEVLNDAKQWAKLMEQGIDNLTGGATGGNTKKRFSDTKYNRAA